ncbi:SCO family protein [Jatrophihabitans endophyticus]|uniref:SCO family protein n=1 Tax=Jatrophihabitans endophyticus TaxID=1206085 RepID=UPI0019E24ABB|nr:SCO family protein [Jatrophihabitans endophyticus]MBE7188645.1 SCO family protein [Jatrophihabitans endophyticus]
MRTLRRPLPLLLGCVAAAALLVLSACSSAPAHIAEPGPSVGEGLNKPLPSSVARTLLISPDAGRLDLASLKGKIVVISDIMTLCQETCPLDTAEVLQAARAVEKAGLGSKVEFLSATIDPRRDTVPQLAAFRKLYGKAPADWKVVTGGVSQLAAFWSKLGVYVKKVPEDDKPVPRNWRTGVKLTYDLDHSDDVIFVDASGRERFALDGPPHVNHGAPIPATLAKFMDADGEHNLTHPAAGAWSAAQELQVLSWLLDKHIPSTG